MMACVLIKAARDTGQPVTATVDSLKRTVAKWERGENVPGDVYWLLYLRIFPELVDGAGPEHARVLATTALAAAQAFPRQREIDAMEAAALRAAGGVREAEIRALASALSVIQEQVAVIAGRLAEMVGDDPGLQP
jgi:hypothetical protein